ncbi:MAG: VCBS repeat-containing protein [Vicinamibacteria bacterium]|nr:VCBS repeat-containing protein [Vicinamibacteria bacterium]
MAVPSVPGLYVARLAATDGAAAAADEVAIAVNATNRPPAVDAGPDQSFAVPGTLGVNLLRNPGNDLPLIGNEIPFWREIAGTDWKKAPTTSPYPAAFDGNSYFFAGSSAPVAELRQDVDVSGLAGTIDSGTQAFVFSGRVRSYPTGTVDMSRIVVEYLSAAGLPLGSFDSGEVGNQTEWQLIEDRRLAPPGTRLIRVRLVATVDLGTSVDAFFDALQLFAPVDLAVPLAGNVADEGLPLEAPLAIGWSVVRGPDSGVFADSANPSTTVTLGGAGAYQLRLTADDSTESRYDDTRITIDPGNQPPAVALGVDRNLASTASALSLTPAVSDDGRPSTALSYSWTAVSGPGDVTFSPAPTALNATLRFSAAGVYVVRLTASDSELDGIDELTIRVGGPNQAPVVDAGADQVVADHVAQLQGQATDDGLPAPGLLTLTWSLEAGPAPVTFDDPYAPATTVRFTRAGTYRLRLLASDGVASASDSVLVAVTPAALLPDLSTTILQADGIVYDPQTLNLAGSLVLSVANLGEGEAPPSTLTVFEDLDGNGGLDPADVVVGSAILPALGPGVSADVGITLNGSLTFPGAPLLALADSAFAIAEASESNNLASTAPACAERTEFAPFAPVLKWAWTGGGVEPHLRSVFAAPAVFDLDADGIPELIFPSFENNDAPEAVLRVVSGRDGTERWTASDPTLRVARGGAPAVGDLDGDGRPEIVVAAVSGTRLLAFGADGTLRWASATIERASTLSTTDYQNAALVDLEGDGLVEIVVGRQVLNSDGTLRWTGAGGKSGQATGNYHTASVVADLDMDGVPEVVAGNTAYRANGSIYWERSSLITGGLGNIPDGYVALGNFDSDPFPEIVAVGNSEVRLLEHDGTLKWGPVLLPAALGSTNRGSGGPPLVADVDDDGEPEIGVAGATAYTVFEGNGTVKWSRPTHDPSSHRTGSSAFDLEGDGSSEVLYADELNLRVYRGSDGAVLFETPMGSATGLEYPLVVDVDADGRAEIVSVANLFDLNTERAGVYVFKDAADQWVPTRRLWNQHSYHVTNIGDDGRVPRREQPSWLTYNSYRQNHLIEGCVFAQADLLPAYVRKVESGSGTTVTARVGNKGGSLAGPGIPVSFYSGDPRAGGTLLGTVATTSPLRPASFEDVSLEIPLGTAALPVWVSADDDGAGHGVRAESDEANNLYESPVYVTATPNQAPVVDAGADVVLEAPVVTAALAGTATDDGQPVTELVYTWGVVSAPANGRVTFASTNTAATSATFEGRGEYVLRLTAFDRDRLGSDEVRVVVTAANTPPVVDAGPDRRLYAPETTSVLAGSVTDDGLPYGSALISNWTVVSGPGPVAISTNQACEVEQPDGRVSCTSMGTAQFSELGTYVLRLTVDDGRGPVHDDVVVQYLPARVNQAPVVDAGPDVTVPLGTNLVVNGGAEDGLAGWTFDPGTFTTATDDVVEGLNRFRALVGNAGIRQDIPVTAFRGRRLDLEVWHRADPSAPFAGLVVVAEFRSATGDVISAHFTPDTIHRSTWSVYAVPLVPPAAAATLRLVLIASSTSGTLVRIDGVSLRPAGAALPLSGTIQDDGLPEPLALTGNWSVVASPGGGSATLAEATCAGVPTSPDGDASAATCNATAGLAGAGAYTFRLAAADVQRDGRPGRRRRLHLPPRGGRRGTGRQRRGHGEPDRCQPAPCRRRGSEPDDYVADERGGPRRLGFGSRRGDVPHPLAAGQRARQRRVR